MVFISYKRKCFYVILNALQMYVQRTKYIYLINNISLCFIVIITALSCIFGHLEEVIPVCFKQFQVPSLFSLQEIQWWPWKIFRTTFTNLSVKSNILPSVGLWLHASEFPGKLLIRWFLWLTQTGGTQSLGGQGQEESSQYICIINRLSRSFPPLCTLNERTPTQAVKWNDMNF